MALGWFNASEAKEFGVTLAHFYMNRIPPGDSDGKNKSIAKRQEVLNKLFLQLAQYKIEHKLNIYKKAQLGNVFKWTLKDAGYDPAFVDELTKELMRV